MGRIINPDSAGKERTRMTKGAALAIRELAKQTSPTGEARDLAAFIALALQAIGETIEISVVAWEKRGYWVKADRFRMEWAWAGELGTKMRTAVIAEDWAAVAMLSAQAAQKLGKVKLSQNHRLGTPWVGAWKQIRQEPNSKGPLA